MVSSVIDQLSGRYPQLLLPIERNEKETTEYKDAVLRGKPVSRKPEFIGAREDSLSSVETPAGTVEIIYLANRKDFEHALQALAYRCEPVDIPASVGANTISGLINWEKINKHKEEYLKAGGTDWNAEFKRFTAVKSNYLDTVILLSSGYYSNISPELIGLDSEIWKEKSFTIRKYHELTHFVCRKLYPDDIIPIRDEVIADLIGLVKAFGEYDTHLAELFLGIEGDSFREGGRLSHYAGDRIDEAVTEAKAYIDYYANLIENRDKEDVFALLLDIFHNT